MNETKSTLPAKIGGAEITRFNALRHGVLSRYTVLKRTRSPPPPTPRDCVAFWRTRCCRGSRPRGRGRGGGRVS